VLKKKEFYIIERKNSTIKLYDKNSIDKRRILCSLVMSGFSSVHENCCKKTAESLRLVENLEFEANPNFEKYSI